MEKPNSSDFVGTWINEYKGKVILMADSTCIVANMRIPNWRLDSQLQSFTGKWYFQEKGYSKNDGPIIVIKEKEQSIYVWFYVSGEGLFNNRPPWYFFQYIGDPYLLDEYAFRKVQ
ncbi:MAG: hypothetical protein LBM06_00160 [Prevotellaceae bacterium]|jgi:hypothetical protein|nr:hypothetical protein [Prevotellaceae bacterium]